MSWQDRCTARKTQQCEQIPKEWVIEPPSQGQYNVISIPQTCGILSERELQITETIDIDLLLRKLASGKWSSVEVTTAYYKRAIVAHQLVMPFHFEAVLRAARGAADFYRPIA